MTEPILTRLNRPRPDVADITVVSNPAPAPSTAKTVIVIGAGGHGRELADIVRAVGEECGTATLVGLIDDGQPDRVVLARSGMRFLGDRSSLDDRSATDIHLGIGDPNVRSAVDAELGQRSAVPLIHPTAAIGSGNSFADGVVVAQHAVITTNVRLGRHTHINVGATVSHDCIVGDYVTVCPGVTITGSVAIENGAFVGAGATILPGITIGSGATVGAGAVVTENVPANQTVVGLPAK